VLPDWYSVQTLNAYQFSIWPCRDKNEWEHVNGEKVSPPKYEKKVDMPPKSRQKQGKMDQNFSNMGAQYITAIAQRLTATVEVVNLQGRISLL
jgi:hypothetical protein